MQIIYYNNELPAILTKSIFLAGPSLRPGQEGESWRKDAIKILEDIGYDGVVFCPENENGKFDEDHDYAATVEWEEKFLNLCDCIVFWIPRNIKTLPGFTTNVEFGNWMSSGKIVLGYPKEAEKMQYLQYYADKLNIASSHSLDETLRTAVDFIADGKERQGGERYVPLYIWNLPQFQSWYQSQISAGNRLDKAKVLYNFRPGNKNFVFLTVIHAEVYITSENRSKINEFVISRPDISSIMLWYKKEPIEESEIILIREFRTPAATKDGFIWELVGGSSPKTDEDPMQIAAEETHEETGCYIEPIRFKYHSAKQLNGTLSSHKSHLYSVDLNQEEMEWFKAQKGIAHGKEADSERTFVEVVKLGQILSNELELDWSNIGQICSIIYSDN